MTNDDIIKIARSVRDGGHWNQLDIMRFAALVAAAEREACAKVCEQQIQRWVDDRARYAAAECCFAIQARGGQ